MTEGPAELLRAVLGAVADGVAVADHSGVVTHFNRQAERLTGIEASAVVGRAAADALPQLGLHEVLSSGRTRSLTLGPGAGAIVLPVPEGSPSYAIAIIQESGGLRSLSEQVSDLWRVRKLLEAVIAATEDAISVADEHGNNIIVNPAYTRLTGMSAEAVIGKPVTVDIAEGQSMHMQVLKTGRPVRNVPMKVGPMGRDVLVNVAPIIMDGEVRGSAGTIHDVSEIKRLTEELSSTRKMLRRLSARYTWDDIIGASAPIMEARALADKAAQTSATVLIRGESGTGKELFAHAIHNASRRGRAQFARVNCSAIAESLLEAELFGYEEGAFTGAAKGGRKGLFREAEGGTVFLDEISELSVRLQSKLLRVLQEREVLPVGGTTPEPVDIRIIAATNADLEAMVRSGTFREDLYYRLNVLPIHIVPLRERAGDIALMLPFLLFRLNQEYHRSAERVAPEAVEALKGYSWPGNVRELINILGRAMLNMHYADKVLELRHLPPLGAPLAERKPAPAAAGETLKDALDAAEREAIRRTLEKSGGSRTKAASALGISIRSLYYKMRRLGLG